MDLEPSLLGDIPFTRIYDALSLSLVRYTWLRILLSKSDVYLRRGRNVTKPK